jgi:hypothetical protein
MSTSWITRAEKISKATKWYKNKLTKKVEKLAPKDVDPEIHELIETDDAMSHIKKHNEAMDNEVAEAGAEGIIAGVKAPLKALGNLVDEVGSPIPQQPKKKSKQPKASPKEQPKASPKQAKADSKQPEVSPQQPEASPKKQPEAKGTDTPPRGRKRKAATSTTTTPTPPTTTAAKSKTQPEAPNLPPELTPETINTQDKKPWLDPLNQKLTEHAQEQELTQDFKRIGGELDNQAVGSSLKDLQQRVSDDQLTSSLQQANDMRLVDDQIAKEQAARQEENRQRGAKTKERLLQEQALREADKQRQEQEGWDAYRANLGEETEKFDAEEAAKKDAAAALAKQKSDALVDNYVTLDAQRQREKANKKQNEDSVAIAREGSERFRQEEAKAAADKKAGEDARKSDIKGRLLKGVQDRNQNNLDLVEAESQTKLGQLREHYLGEEKLDRQKAIQRKQEAALSGKLSPGEAKDIMEANNFELANKYPDKYQAVLGELTVPKDTPTPKESTAKKALKALGVGAGAGAAIGGAAYAVSGKEKKPAKLAPENDEIASELARVRKRVEKDPSLLTPEIQAVLDMYE